MPTKRTLYSAEKFSNTYIRDLKKKKQDATRDSSYTRRIVGVLPVSVQTPSAVVTFSIY